jgi:hypothetical protein
VSSFICVRLVSLNFGMLLFRVRARGLTNPTNPRQGAELSDLPSIVAPLQRSSYAPPSEHAPLLAAFLFLWVMFGIVSQVHFLCVNAVLVCSHPLCIGT